MTHAELVERAERWLRGTMGCGVVLTECSGAGYEMPDAIGWDGFHSVLVECKASRSDFRADRAKPFRATRAFGVGCCRYYFTPKGMVSREEVPPRWGLAEVHPSDRVRRAVACAHLDLPPFNLRRERGLLLSELRKFQMVLAGESLHPSRAADRVLATVAAMSREVGT